MTFDEAIEHFRNNTDISGTAVFLDDVEDTLKELREEYAPTIEMTKEQKRTLDNYREPGLFDGDYVFNAFYEDTHAHRIGTVSYTHLTLPTIA